MSENICKKFCTTLSCPICDDDLDDIDLMRVHLDLAHFNKTKKCSISNASSDVLFHVGKQVGKCNCGQSDSASNYDYIDRNYKQMPKKLRKLLREESKLDVRQNKRSYTKKIVKMSFVSRNII